MHPYDVNFLFPLPGCLLKIRLPRDEFVFLCAHHESHYDPTSLVALAAGVLRDRSVAVPGGVQNLTAHSRRTDFAAACNFFFAPILLLLLLVLSGKSCLGQERLSIYLN